METYLTIRRNLRQQIRQSMLLDESLKDENLEAHIEEQVHLALLGLGFSLAQRRQLIAELNSALTGLDVLQSLMENERISEIMVNGPHCIFVEQEGRLYRSPLQFDDAEHLSDVIRYFFSKGNKNINLSRPIEDLRLEDGSRANAILPPLAPDGPILTIRKFCGIRPSAQALIESHFIEPYWLNQLQTWVHDRKSIFISGGTGTGKTTLLNILSQSIAKQERIVTVEDSAELQLLEAEHLVRLEGRSASPDGTGFIGLAELIRTALRMRPDRLIVGEVRGAEAVELLNAMNTGHPGALCTAHANSCLDLLRRLSHLILSATHLPYFAVVEMLSANLDYLIHIERLPNGHRRVAEIARVLDASEHFQVDLLYQANKEIPAHETSL